MIDWAQVRLVLPDGRADDFWSAALGWPRGAPWTAHPEVAGFEPTDGDSYIHRVRVAGTPAVQVVLETDDVAADARRLVGWGASGERPGAPGWLTSPGGWAFGLTTARPHRRPGAQVWPGGQRGRLVQVSIDSPADLHDREVGFWTQALGWEWRASDAPEFAGKLIRPGSSVQFLLHRLDPDDPGTQVRAHLDLGTDELTAETDRLVAAGAEQLWTGGGWITLRDPAGMLFCVTENSPDAP